MSIKGPKGPRGPYSDDRPETEPDIAIHEISGYHGLPVCIKTHITMKDYQWMGDYARQRLIEDFTQPQGIED